MNRQHGLVAAVVAAGASAGLDAGEVRYAVTDLGTVPGSATCVCFTGVGLSDNGKAVGRFFGANGLYAGFLWQDGVMTDVGSLGGGLTQILDVRSDGVAVGHSRIAGGTNTEHAFRLENGQMTDLGTLNGGVHSYASGINDAGTIAGMSTGRGPSNTSIQRAVIWIGGAGGQIIDLGTLGGVFSEGIGINNAGQVVGWAWDPAWRQRGFVWSPQGGMVDVGDFGAAGSVVARAIADTGVAVGVAPGAGAAEGHDRAFRWESGVLMDLGVLPEAGSQQGIFGPELVNTAAAGVNSAGQIVGNSYPGSDAPPLRPGPFIWENGVMTNLNDLVEPGWVILSVGGINESGQIVGTARAGGATTGSRAVILTPTGCYANCDGSGAAPVLNVNDFVCFLNRYAGGDPYANCDGSSTPPVLNISDFSCFLNRYAGGCP